MHTVYVAGVALEYCVQATCLGLLDRYKRTVALENALAAATDDKHRTEKVWSNLVER
ncbi:isochorismatase family protein, partial [bacterium]